MKGQISSKVWGGQKSLFPKTDVLSNASNHEMVVWQQHCKHDKWLNHCRFSAKTLHAQTSVNSACHAKVYFALKPPLAYWGSYFSGPHPVPLTLKRLKPTRKKQGTLGLRAILCRVMTTSVEASQDFLQNLGVDSYVQKLNYYSSPGREESKYS